MYIECVFLSHSKLLFVHSIARKYNFVNDVKKCRVEPSVPTLRFCPKFCPKISSTLRFCQKKHCSGGLNLILQTQFRYCKRLPILILNNSLSCPVKNLVFFIHSNFYGNRQFFLLFSAKFQESIITFLVQFLKDRLFFLLF